MMIWLVFVHVPVVFVHVPVVLAICLAPGFELLGPL